MYFVVTIIINLILINIYKPKAYIVTVNTIRKIQTSSQSQAKYSNTICYHEEN